MSSTLSPTNLAVDSISVIDLSVSGSFNITGYNNTNWDTAYGWGDHSTEGYATTTYVDTSVANLVDSAPATLDTLNELAAALGDDPNFATTVTTQIGTKWTQDNTKISNWDTAYSWGDHSTAGYLTSYTETDPTVPAHVKSITTTDISNWNTAYGWGDHSTEGYTVDGTDVTFSSVQITGGTGTQGTLSWNSVDGTLDLDLGTATLQVGQEEHFYAKATEVIANGDVVMFAGAQGDHVLIAKANHSAVGFKPEYIMGVATQAFANNAFGYVTTFGKVRGLNTSTLDEGDILYSDPSNPGALTTTRPSSPDHVIQVAAVLSSNPAQGVILVRLTHFLDTDEVEEGSTNLYFTDARAVSAIQADASWNAANWDTAYSWGDHASAGYLQDTNSLSELNNDLWEITTTTPTSGAGKPVGYVWYVV